MTRPHSYPSDLPETPSQTAGPYVHIGLIPEQAGFEIFENNFSGDIAGPDVEGERIVIEGRIFDGAGHATKDVLVETWQANAAGRYNHPADRQDKPLDNAFAAGHGPAPISKPASTRFAPSSRAASPGARAARPWRRMSTSGLPPGASISDSPPACISATRKPRTPRIPCLNIIEQPERRQTLIAAASERTERSLHVRHPSPRRTRDCVLRRLITPIAREAWRIDHVFKCGEAADRRRTIVTG